MVNSRRVAATLAAVGVIFLSAPFALAQTGFDLMGKPMPTGEYIQTTGDARLFNEGTNDRKGAGGENFQLQTYDLRGRFRLLPGERADPRFGYDLKQFE